jgi:hypothetical protein
MPIYAKVSGTNYTPAPQGTHAAVCVDVVDLGIIETTYSGKTKKQYKIKIVWQIDETRGDGKPFIVSKRYTNSLHEKASMRKDLESWRGRPFEEAELEQFDLEVLLSVGAMVNVIHNVKDGSTYANVAAVMKLPKGVAAPTPREYVRECDREPVADEQAPAAIDEYLGGITDDDIPF